MFPDLEALQVIARAITPPRRPKRFDTRFFAIDRTAIADEVGGWSVPIAELIELAWVTIAEAKRLDLPPITLTILEDLEDRIAQGFARSFRSRSTASTGGVRARTALSRCALATGPRRARERSRRRSPASRSSALESV